MIGLVISLNKPEPTYEFEATASELSAIRILLHTARLGLINLIDESREGHHSELMLELINYAETEITHIDKILGDRSWLPSYPEPYRHD